MTAVLARVGTSVHAVLDRLRPDLLLRLGRQGTAREFCGHLEGDEHLVDERGSPRLERGEVLGASGGIGAHGAPTDCQDWAVGIMTRIRLSE